MTHLLTTVRNLPTLFDRLGAWETVAELLGGLSVALISPTYGEEADRLAAASEALGASRYAAALERGRDRTLAQTARLATAALRDLTAG